MSTTGTSSNRPEERDRAARRPLTYQAVPLKEFASVLLKAARSEQLVKALEDLNKSLERAPDQDVLFPDDSVEAGKRIFQFLGICAGTTAAAFAIINNLTATVVSTATGATLDITFNAVLATTNPPCSFPVLAGISVSLAPPGLPAVNGAAVKIGPPPAAPPAMAPAPAAPAVDVPTSGQLVITATQAALLVGTVATVTVTYNVTKTGGWCDTCTSTPTISVSAAVNIV